jgi:hypothetical protein
VPEEDLLVFNVKEGWHPFCEFLGEEVPDEALLRRIDKFAFAKNNEQFGHPMWHHLYTYSHLSL